MTDNLISHSTIHTCFCGYSTWSQKWMKKHMENVHKENGIWAFEVSE